MEAQGVWVTMERSKVFVCSCSVWRLNTQTGGTLLRGGESQGGAALRSLWCVVNCEKKSQTVFYPHAVLHSRSQVWLFYHQREVEKKSFHIHSQTSVPPHMYTLMFTVGL